MASFIVFEGGDGAGKTTQARALIRKLGREGYPARLTREPGGTPLGESMRRQLKQRHDLSPLSELFLVAASRAQLVERVVGPSLNQGITVVCDRYVASTVAYQGYGRGLDLELIDRVNGAVTGGLYPDLTVLLDLPADQAINRKRNSKSDVFDTAPSDFHRKVREGYLSQAAREPLRWLVLDGANSARDLARQIWDKIQPLL